MPTQPSLYRCAKCGNEVPVVEVSQTARGSRGAIQLRPTVWCENGHEPRPMDLSYSALRRDGEH